MPYIYCFGGYRVPFDNIARLNTSHEEDIAINGRGSAIMSGEAFIPAISSPPNQPSNGSKQGDEVAEDMLGKIRDGLTPVERITKVRVPRANKEAVRQELRR